MAKATITCIVDGLYPLAERVAAAGCPFYFIEELDGYVPLHNEKMEPLIGLYVADNVTGIEGPDLGVTSRVFV